MISNSRTLVFGKTGQLARSLSKTFPEAIFLDRHSADFNDSASVDKALEKYDPQLVVTAAAYTDVEKAESDTERCFQVNARTPTQIAKWCRKRGASLVHFSTDYVYGGDGYLPWPEDSYTKPLNQYGASKLEGELGVLETGCHAFILRTSWLYSSQGKNFLNTMYRLGKERESLAVVSDQIGAPTFSNDLASATLHIVRHKDFFNSNGIFNFANLGETSWHGFASAIFDKMRVIGTPLTVRMVNAISSEEFQTKALRPKNSRLDTTKIRNTFDLTIRRWDDALDDCLKSMRA